MIAGTGSGCGKTMVTLAVLRAMQRRNIPLAAFKCGPDYIDPMFHKAVLGIPSRNLDLFSSVSVKYAVRLCAAFHKTVSA